MKTEMFYGYEFEFKSLESLKKAMEEYIDYYNNRRIKSKLKGMSPVEFREHSCQN
jgi:putative transposase